MKKLMQILRIISIILIITMSIWGVAYKFAGKEVSELLGAIGISWVFPIYWTLFLLGVALVVASQQMLYYIEMKGKDELNKQDNN